MTYNGLWLGESAVLNRTKFGSAQTKAKVVVFKLKLIKGLGFGEWDRRSFGKAQIPNFCQTDVIRR